MGSKAKKVGNHLNALFTVIREADMAHCCVISGATACCIRLMSCSLALNHKVSDSPSLNDQEPKWSLSSYTKSLFGESFLKSG